MPMLFSCESIKNEDTKRKVDYINKYVGGLARLPVCLPNIHFRPELESPPQFVTATHNTIVPQLSAPAMNCGMSVFTTNLTKDDFSEEFLSEFAKKLRAGVGPRRTKIQMILARFGFSKTQTPYDLSREEFEMFLLEGSPGAIKI